MPHPINPSTFLRGVVFCLALILCLQSGSAWAQNDPLLGTFSDGWFSLTIAGGGGQYQGQIDVGGQAYAFTAQGSAARIDGFYSADGQQFQFAATLQGETLTFWNATQTFTLARQAGAPAGQAAVGQPAPPAASGYLAPGTRLTYEQAVGSNPGAGAGPGVQGTGGRGYIEIDVYYHDPQVCVAKLAMYTAGMMVNSLSRTATEVIIGEGGFCSTYWAPPGVLAEYTAPEGGIQRVERGPFELGGRSYNAIYIANEFENVRVTRVYDLASGILLSEVEGFGERGYSTGENQQAAGSGVQNLVNVRQVSLPWSFADPLPANVQGLGTLTYKGDYTTSVPGVYMWDSSLVSPFDISVVVQQRNPTWQLAQSTMNMTFPGSNIPQPPVVNKVIVNAVSGHYVPVEAFGRLSAGQVLDTDPITGIRWYVERNDAGGLVIINEGPGMRASATYDPRTGLMVRSQLEQQSDGQNLRIRQELVGAQ